MSTGRPEEKLMDAEAIDRAIRLNELQERARELGLESVHVDERCTPEIQEKFIGSVLDLESAPVGTQFDRLVKSGVVMPEPTSLNDAALHEKLWEVIGALARFESYLYHTDHLSDRDLYEQLWRDTLREEVSLFPPGSGWRCHIDLIGGGSEEDMEIALRYYDSDERRVEWLKEFPNTKMPAKESPPFDRDRLLPKVVEEWVSDEQELDDEFWEEEDGEDE